MTTDDPTSRPVDETTAAVMFAANRVLAAADGGVIVYPTGDAEGDGAIEALRAALAADDAARAEMDGETER